MSWSFRIAKIGPTEVRIHLTFVLLLAWIAYAYYVRGGVAAATSGLIFILLLFFCVLLHEFGHVLAARAYGIQTPDITLLPIGGVARLQRMPDHPVQELVVAVAGPAVNVVIAAALFLGLGLRGWHGQDLRLDDPGVDMLRRVLSVNVILVLFNLIPAFPMDGGRVLRAVLAMRTDYARATRTAAVVGQLCAFGFAFWGLAIQPNLFLVLIALFIFIAGSQEAAAVQMREAARGLRVAEAMIRDFRTLPATATLQQAAEALLSTSQREFPISDAGTNAIVGLLTRENLIEGLKSAGPGGPVTAFMSGPVRMVPVWAGFDEAYRIMQETETPAVLVMDGRGAVVGMVTPENVGEMMMIQAAIRQRGSGGMGGGKPGGLAPPPIPPRPAAGY